MDLDEPITHAILDNCKRDPEYKEEILDFLTRLEQAIEEIRQRIGESMIAELTTWYAILLVVWWGT